MNCQNVAPPEDLAGGTDADPLEALTLATAFAAC